MRGKFFVVSPAFGSELVEGPRATAVFFIHKLYCRKGESVSLYRQGERGLVTLVRQDTVLADTASQAVSQ
jgi:hypothetical protein